MATTARHGRRSLLLLLLFTLLGHALLAQTTKDQTASDILNRRYLLGDWGGARSKLAEQKGISFDFFLHTDLLANPEGGNEQAATGWNRVRGTMDVDMGKLAHVKGMSLHITGLMNVGTGVGEPRYLGSLASPSGNYTGLHQVRLDSFWLKQDLFNGRLTLWAGQISGMDFFGLSPDLGNYVMEPLFYAPFALYNTYSSWDPATTPAAMLQISPNRHFYYRAHVQAGNHQEIARDPSGVDLAVRDGAVWNNEFGFLTGQRYKGQYRVGVSYTGASLKAFPVVKPGTTADGNINFYVMTKQAVWRPTAGSERGLDLRFDLLVSPEDHGVLPYNKEIVVGAVFNAPLRSRPKDTLNIGMNYYGIRNFLNTPQRAATLVPGTRLFAPVTSEKAYEVNYSVQATPWLQWMPVVQIYQDLGANAKNGTGVVAGFRTKVSF